MAEREIERWITVNGTRVPIFKGESVEDAIKRKIGNKKETDKKESETKQTETQKQISSDQDKKEEQIANNRREAEQAGNKQADTKSNVDRIYERYKDKIDEEAEKFREKWGNSYDDDKLKKELATMKSINEKPYATTDTVAKQFALQKEYDMRQKVDEIAERYVTSNPVSGSWDTETAHQQNAIAKELGISKEAAKNIMIKRLGFSKDDFK